MGISPQKGVNQGDSGQHSVLNCAQTKRTQNALKHNVVSELTTSETVCD